MSTQIGVDEVIPWQANRSIAKWKAGRTDRKWRQVLGAATEQSRRVWSPELAQCVSSKQVVAICRRACVHGDLVIVLHQDATMSWSSVEDEVSRLADRCLADGRPRSINVVVGPEGGISEEEVSDFVGAGAQSVVLGSNILRASTAGPVALAARGCWGRTQCGSDFITPATRSAPNTSDTAGPPSGPSPSSLGGRRSRSPRMRVPSVFNTGPAPRTYRYGSLTSRADGDNGVITPVRWRPVDEVIRQNDTRS